MQSKKLQRVINLADLTLEELIELRPSKMTQCTNDVYSFLIDMKETGVQTITFLAVSKCINHPRSTIYRSLSAIYNILAGKQKVDRLYSCTNKEKRTYVRTKPFVYSGGHQSFKPLQNGFTQWSDITCDYRSFILPNKVNPNYINILNKLNINSHNIIFDNIIRGELLSQSSQYLSDNVCDVIPTSPAGEDGHTIPAIKSVQEIYLDEGRKIPGNIIVEQENNEYSQIEDMISKCVRELLPSILEEILPQVLVNLHKKQLSKTIESPKPILVSDIKPSAKQVLQDELAKTLPKISVKELTEIQPAVKTAVSKSTEKHILIRNWCNVFANYFLSNTKSAYSRISKKDQNCMNLAIDFYGDKMEDSIKWLFENYRTLIDGYPSIGVLWGFRTTILAGVDGVKKKDGGISQWNEKAAEERKEKYAGLSDAEAQELEYLEWAEKN